jgi:thioredoxin-related protein
LKRSALLAVAALLLAQQALAGSWLTSVSAAQKRAKEKRQLIFVDLFADWCGWCHRMEQEVFPSLAFQKASSNKVLLRLNTEDGGEGTKLSQQFGVSSLPTFLLLTSDLTIAGVIRGYLPTDPFVQAMNDTEGKYKDFRKRVSNESAIATDYQKRLDLAREFRSRYALAESEKRLRKLTEPGVPIKVRDDAYYELAFTQVLGRNYVAALKTLRDFSAVQTKGDAYERSRVLTANIYLQQGNYAGALDEFKKFKKAFPNSPLMANVDMVLPALEKQVGGRVQ